MPARNFYSPFIMPDFNIFAPVNYYNSLNTSPSVSIFSKKQGRPEKFSHNYKIVNPKPQKTYNKVNGEKLAQKVVQNLPTDRDPNNPLCAKYVKKAIQDCGLGEYVKGNAAYCKNIFRANPNFKEVKYKDFSKLPTGTLVVYDAFDKVTFQDGKEGKIGKHGHTLIALKDGKGCSDIIENEIAYSSKAHTFIPV